MDENRFKDLKGLTDEQLLELKEEIQKEIDSLCELLDAPDTSSEFRSEIENSDLPYEEDRLEAVQNLISTRGIGGKSR